MDTTALVLTIVGALNWALVGIFQFDLVAWIFGGQGALLSRIIYTVIGLAGIWCISLLFKDHPLDAGETHQQAGRGHGGPQNCKCSIAGSKIHKKI